MTRITNDTAKKRSNPAIDEGLSYFIMGAISIVFMREIVEIHEFFAEHNLLYIPAVYGIVCAIAVAIVAKKRIKRIAKLIIRTIVACPAGMLIGMVFSSLIDHIYRAMIIVTIATLLLTIMVAIAPEWFEKERRAIAFCAVAYTAAFFVMYAIAGGFVDFGAVVISVVTFIVLSGFWYSDTMGYIAEEEERKEKANSNPATDELSPASDD